MLKLIQKEPLYKSMEQPGTAMSMRVFWGRIAGPSCRFATIHPARIFIEGINFILTIVSWVTLLMRQLDQELPGDE